MRYVHDYFVGRNRGDKLPEELKNHRYITQNFVNKKLKRVLVVATMSAGKSTLVNALVGRRVNQVKATACTSILHYIYNKPSREGAMASYIGNKLVYTVDSYTLASESVHSIGINFATSLSNSRICLIDTPGVNYSGNKAHGELTKNAIKKNNYDLLIVVLNGQQLAIEDERDLVHFIGKYCKQKVIGVLNQCDTYKPSQDSIEEALMTGKNMMKEAGIKNPIVLPISAYGAFLSRQSAEFGSKMDEDDAFDYELISKKLNKPYYNFPSYLPGIARDNSGGILDRTGVPYLERLINTL